MLLPPRHNGRSWRQKRSQRCHPGTLVPDFENEPCLLQRASFASRSTELSGVHSCSAAQKCFYRGSHSAVCFSLRFLHGYAPLYWAVLRRGVKTRKEKGEFYACLLANNALLSRQLCRERLGPTFTVLGGKGSDRFLKFYHF